MADDLYTLVAVYADDLISFFTGGAKMENEVYIEMRSDLLRNPAYAGLAPDFLRRNRDTSALWSFAKSVDPSWEPRRRFIREQFEPLLDFLEKGGGQPITMPGSYDASAWTGVSSAQQRTRAVQTLVPLARAAISTLIAHLEKPSHNGGPPLDEVTRAIDNLTKLHGALGELLALADDGKLVSPIGEGLAVEAASYGRRAARLLKDDPMPYAMSATLLAVLTACGFPGLGGYLAGIAAVITKKGSGS